jgi:hypothetical protein
MVDKREFVLFNCPNNLTSKSLNCPSCTLVSLCRLVTPGQVTIPSAHETVVCNIQSKIEINQVYFYMFHVRALYHTKTLITNKCTKRVLSSIVTHCYMFRPCWVIFRENTLLPLHWGCTLQLSENVLLAVWCVVFRGVNSPRSRPAGPDRREFTPPVHSPQHILTQL